MAANSRESLKKMNKPMLLEFAQSLKLDVSSSMVKDKIIDEILKRVPTDTERQQIKNPFLFNGNTPDSFKEFIGYIENPQVQFCQIHLSIQNINQMAMFSNVVYEKGFELCHIIERFTNGPILIFKRLR